MKKYFLWVLTAALSAVLAGPVWAADKAVVLGIQGAPMLVRGGQTMPISKGMEFQKDDVIQTSQNCMADLSMNNLAGCRVLPASQIAIADAEKGGMRLKIESGNAVFNLEKLPKDSTFEVETPTAVAAVRGTQFWGRVAMDPAASPVTTFAVRQGSVQIFAKAAQKSFLIQKGEALDIPADASKTPSVRPALEGEMQAMTQADTIHTAA